jgi:hypothetical protein
MATNIISFPANATIASATITVDSVLTTYTSYTTTTFVSAGTTYKESQGVPVVVTDSAEFSSLSAAGVFQTAASSSAISSGFSKTALTGSQTVRGMWS